METQPWEGTFNRGLGVLHRSSAVNGLSLLQLRDKPVVSGLF